MIKRTNLALGIGVALYFFPHVNNKVTFLLVVLISTLIPEFHLAFSRRKDSGNSSFTRKILRTYLTPIAGSLILSFIYPVIALPFFLGYSFTLSLDTFSKEGIQPFWPISKKHTNGHITAGGRTDTVLFYALVLFDIALLINLFI